MPTVNIVVIGASAGGLQALCEILGELPSGIGAAILAVVHTPAARGSNLPAVLSRAGPLPVSFCSQDQSLEGGHVYVAPPDYHMLVTNLGATLNHGPKENGFRPAIDPLFRTAARRYGERVMGVVLSGALDDGAYGLKLIKDAGGIAVVQDPNEAAVQSMPLSAMQNVAVDHMLTATRIARLITESTGPQFEGSAAMARTKETDPAEKDEEITIEEMKDEFGPASALTCPDCGGALWEIIDGQLVRYRCHVGHQYSSDGLDSGQRDVVEEALWTAVRVLEEHADLRSRMSRRAGVAGLDAVSSSFAESAQAAHAQAQTLRDLLVATGVPPNRTRLVASTAPRRPAQRRPATKGKAVKRRR
jgi:two-component system chemotaxis response regulator CheB